jgi:lysophospholipase L1-like esterase
MFISRSAHKKLLRPAIATITLVLAAPLFAGNDKNYNYLALGDSVAYGLDITKLTQVPPPVSTDFIGYPEAVAEYEHWLKSKKEVNAACPGETSGSFINAALPDYGCNSMGPDGEPPFKQTPLLHTNYTGSQLGFALDQLSSNKHISLVTLGIGSNDVFLLLRQCATDPHPDVCVNSGIGGVLQTYVRNLTEILTAIRRVYSGTLILVTYYSPYPLNSPLTPLAVLVNQNMIAVGSQFNARIADGFTPFQLASALYGFDPCAAGLLVRINSTTCDIHPSPAGRNLLAAAVELALNTGN